MYQQCQYHGDFDYYPLCTLLELRFRRECPFKLVQAKVSCDHALGLPDYNSEPGRLIQECVATSHLPSYFGQRILDMHVMLLKLK